MLCVRQSSERRSVLARVELRSKRHTLPNWVQAKHAAGPAPEATMISAQSTLILRASL